jgi:transposase
VQIDPDALPDDAAALQQMLRTVLLQQSALHAENDKLRLLIQRLTRHQFGRRSEQLSPDQLQLGLEDLEQTIAAKDGAMLGKRKRYSAEFKAKVAMEALRGELTTSQLATKHGVHQTMVGEWKRQAMEGLVAVFSGKAEVKEGIRRRNWRSCTPRSVGWWWSGIF